MAQLNSDGVNIIVREGPSTESASVGKLRDGDTMQVLGVDGNWVNVAKDSANGYVLKKYLTALTQYNVVLKYSGNGATYQIGHTAAEYQAGAQNFADEFSKYYTSDDFSSEASQEVVGFVTVNTGSEDVSLNLRAEANSGAEVLTKVPNGTSLRVLSEEVGWTKVGYGEEIGYLLNDYLDFWEGVASDVEAQTSEEDTAETDEDTAETILASVIDNADGSRAILYDSGSEDANQLGTLSAGVQVEVVEIVEGDNWVLVSYEGQQGYMMDSNLQFELM